MIYAVALGAFVFTMLGGFFALRFQDKLHLILGFSAGAIIGVAFFDLLPEALELAGASFDISTVTVVVALGFLTYTILDRMFSLHEHAHKHRGRFGAGSLSIHSFLDGIAIGLAFNVSPATGIIVAIAVLTHDFSDGINTVGMILRHGGTKKQAFKWLIADSLAPILGIILASFITLPEGQLGLLLALFCGFFLYIGASDLLPESHHSHPTRWTTLATALGMGVLYLAVSYAGI